MRDAIGTFVAWPKNLITIDEVISEKLKDNVGTKSGNTKKSVVSPAKNRGKEGIQNPSLEIGVVRHTPYCNYLGIHVDLFMKSQNTTHGVIMEKEIFGKYFEESIGVDEINNVLQHRWIGVSEICVYIRYLYENFMVQNQSSRRFFFLSPHETGFVLKKQEQQKSLVDLLVQNGAKDKLVLAPYNISVHWVLLAINVKAETIYYLDSMHGDPVNHRDMVDIFNMVLQVFRPQVGMVVPKSKSKSIKWKKIKCPKQNNDVDCGYYVLRFMKDIITCNQMAIPDEYFSGYQCVRYSEEHINDVREEWARYVASLLGK